MCVCVCTCVCLCLHQEASAPAHGHREAQTRRTHVMGLLIASKVACVSSTNCFQTCACIKVTANIQHTMVERGIKHAWHNHHNHHHNHHHQATVPCRSCGSRPAPPLLIRPGAGAGGPAHTNGTEATTQHNSSQRQVRQCCDPFLTRTPQPFCPCRIMHTAVLHQTHARTRAHTHAHTHTRTHARTHTRTHAHTHTHTHTHAGGQTFGSTIIFFTTGSRFATRRLTSSTAS